MKIYAIVDRTDAFHKEKFRSIHTTLEDAATYLVEYTKNYSEQAKRLVEIVQWEVKE